MKRIFLVLIALFLIAGCSSGGGEKPAIRINDIEVTAGEFDEAFRSSNTLHMDENGKREFLDSFISRKLMLKEAEKLGLDKEKEFLSDIQLFWEQSLLKAILSVKTKELSLGVNVSESEIRAYYEKNRDYFGESELAQVYDKIKWLVLKQKQQAAITGWVDSLKNRSNIKIEYDLLGIDKK
ncbi:MAG: SurA N-terminal domain-containing protein [Candidatus Omnitrophota bacterium]